MALPRIGEIIRYSVSYITQGKYKFYSLTIPSDVLANTCFATTREDDPIEGFQRVLDPKRAKEISEYIDNALGTIPSSIVLSAQPEANLQIVGRGKTLEFKYTPKAFLILDGQHRVYGFSMAKTALRIPVIIYNGLSRKEESRLFIDINTKQRPVSSELLLDIKQLAEYETDQEQICREIFDHFHSETDSPLLGLLSPAKKSKKKISRTTFYSAIKPLLPLFPGFDTYDIYSALRSYYGAFIAGASDLNTKNVITNAIVFRAVAQLFKTVAVRVKDRHGPNYSTDHFFEVLEPMFSKVKISKLENPGRSIKELTDHLENALASSFTL